MMVFLSGGCVCLRLCGKVVVVFVGEVIFGCD